MPIPDFVEFKVTGIDLETDAVERPRIGKDLAITGILGKTDASENRIVVITVDFGIRGRIIVFVAIIADEVVHFLGGATGGPQLIALHADFEPQSIEFGQRYAVIDRKGGLINQKITGIVFAGIGFDDTEVKSAADPFRRVIGVPIR